MGNKFTRIADKLNRSPVWNHTLLYLRMYTLEMIVFIAIVIGKLFVGKFFLSEYLKLWLIMTVPLIVVWLLLGLRNYRIHKKMGIWKYYQSKTRNGKLID